MVIYGGLGGDLGPLRGDLGNPKVIWGHLGGMGTLGGDLGPLRGDLRSPKGIWGPLGVMGTLGEGVRPPKAVGPYDTGH